MRALSLSQPDPGMTQTHLHVLVRCLLVLLGHGGWGTLGERADSGEDTERDGHTDHGVCENLDALSWWILGAWAVWSESDPVSYVNTSVHVLIYPPSIPPSIFYRF